MPNNNTDPQGKKTASATCFSSMSRTSGAEPCTLVPPSSVTSSAMVACAGRIFMPLMSAGLAGRMNCARIVHEGEAELDVLHLLGRVFAIPGVERDRAALGVRHQERQFAGGDDREAAGLIAGVDVSEVGDAIARHVVMVEGLAELLGGIDLVFDGAAGVLLHGGAPFFQRLLQRVRRRHPVRELEFEGFILGERRGRRADQGGESGRAEAGGQAGQHKIPPRFKCWLRGQLFYYSAACRGRCKGYSLISNYVPDRRFSAVARGRKWRG